MKSFLVKKAPCNLFVHRLEFRRQSAKGSTLWQCDNVTTYKCPIDDKESSLLYIRKVQMFILEIGYGSRSFYMVIWSPMSAIGFFSTIDWHDTLKDDFHVDQPSILGLASHCGPSYTLSNYYSLKRTQKNCIIYPWINV